jgi:hypothetical protein
LNKLAENYLTRSIIEEGLEGAKALEHQFAGQIRQCLRLEKKFYELDGNNYLGYRHMLQQARSAFAYKIFNLQYANAQNEAFIFTLDVLGYVQKPGKVTGVGMALDIALSEVENLIVNKLEANNELNNIAMAKALFTFQAAIDNVCAQAGIDTDLEAFLSREPVRMLPINAAPAKDILVYELLHEGLDYFLEEGGEMNGVSSLTWNETFWNKPVYASTEMAAGGEQLMRYWTANTTSEFTKICKNFQTTPDGKVKKDDMVKIMRAFMAERYSFKKVGAKPTITQAGGIAVEPDIQNLNYGVDANTETVFKTFNNSFFGFFRFPPSGDANNPTITDIVLSNNALVTLNPIYANNKDNPQFQQELQALHGDYDIIDRLIWVMLKQPTKNLAQRALAGVVAMVGADNSLLHRTLSLFIDVAIEYIYCGGNVACLVAQYARQLVGAVVEGVITAVFNTIRENVEQTILRYLLPFQKQASASMVKTLPYPLSHYIDWLSDNCNLCVQDTDICVLYKLVRKSATMAGMSHNDATQAITKLCNALPNNQMKEGIAHKLLAMKAGTDGKGGNDWVRSFLGDVLQHPCPDVNICNNLSKLKVEHIDGWEIVQDAQQSPTLNSYLAKNFDIVVDATICYNFRKNERSQLVSAINSASLGKGEFLGHLSAIVELDNASFLARYDRYGATKDEAFTNFRSSGTCTIDGTPINTVSINQINSLTHLAGQRETLRDNYRQATTDAAKISIKKDIIDKSEEIAETAANVYFMNNLGYADLPCTFGTSKQGQFDKVYGKYNANNQLTEIVIVECKGGSSWEHLWFVPSFRCF